jgi:hypothetical protein
MIWIPDRGWDMLRVIYMGSVQKGDAMEMTSPALPADADLHKIIISTAQGLLEPIKMAIGMCDARNGVVADRAAIDWITDDIGGWHTIQIYGQTDLYIDRIVGDNNRSLYIYCNNTSNAPVSILATYAIPDTCYG